MAQKIGYNDGIEGFVGFMRKIPFVKYRPAADRPSSLSTWFWLEKIERTLRILKDTHDATIVSPTPDPPPPPPPPSSPVAPRTYQAAPGGEPSARFCVTGLARNANGRLHDVYSEYDDDGHDLGGRSQFQPGLKPANEMDGRGPCDSYEYNGRTFPPWPTESYAR